jgi:hypothetical protein
MFQKKNIYNIVDKEDKEDRDNFMNKIKVHIDDWIDAQQFAKSNPNNFQVPTIEQLNDIKVDYSVKISNGKERFFVTVIEIHKNDYITGIINNKLCFNSPYGYDDLVMFQKKNIYNIHTVEDREDISNMVKDLNIKDDIIRLVDKTINVVSK